MVYKSKKINKNRYFKRKSRKLIKKRMYGGGEEQVTTVLGNIKEEQVPTVLDNIKDVGNLGVSLATNVVADGIQGAAEYAGLNPNVSMDENVEKASNKIKYIVNVLNSPEGEELKKNAGELLEDVVDVLDPSVKKVEEILMDGAEKLAKTGTSIVVTAANEIPPVFVVNEAAKLITAGLQAGETLAKVATTGAEALGSLQDQKNNAVSLLEETQQIFSDAIKVDQKNVDEYGENIVKKGKQIFPTQGGSLKKYRNEKMMIGGRIIQSQLEFLGGHLNTSLNLQQYGGKWNTKSRRSLKRRLTSRRH